MREAHKPRVLIGWRRLAGDAPAWATKRGASNSHFGFWLNFAAREDARPPVFGGALGRARLCRAVTREGIRLTERAGEAIMRIAFAGWPVLATWGLSE